MGGAWGFKKFGYWVFEVIKDLEFEKNVAHFTLVSKSLENNTLVSLVGPSLQYLFKYY